MMGQWAQLAREWARACCKSNKLTKKLLLVSIYICFARLFFLSVLINNADCREDGAGGEEVLMAD